MKFASNMNCCVPQCTAYHRRNPELSFHSFPTCDKRRKEWIRLLRVGKNAMYIDILPPNGMILSPI